MNVNPVAAPGPVSTGQIATRAESQQAHAGASARAEVRQRQIATAAEQGNRVVSSKLDPGRQTSIADQVANNQADNVDRQKAEQLAINNDYQSAVEWLEKATMELVKVIRRGGIYIPSA